MKEDKELGNKGEEIACEYLKREGYQIIDRNWHNGHLELDIVALNGDELVVVEVKSRNGLSFEFPSDALPAKKIRGIVDATDAYLIEHELKYETRFDLITIIFNMDKFTLEHFKEAFYPTL